MLEFDINYYVIGLRKKQSRMQQVGLNTYIISM